MQKKLKSNVWKYALFLITNKRIVVAILGAYYLTIPGVTAQGIGVILLAGSVAGFLFEIPSGYVSDKVGHKQALVFSRICALLSTLFFLFASSLTWLILGGVFLSIGAAFVSGTGSAFMHETLRALGRETEYAQVMGKVRSIGFAVPIAFMVIVPFLVDISYRLPFAIMFVFDIVGLITVLSFVAPKISAEQIKEIGTTNFKKVMQEGYAFGFFKYALFVGVVGGFVFSISGFRPAYQLVLGIPVIYFGVFFGIGRVFASLLLVVSGYIKKHTTLFSFFFFEMIAHIVLFVLLGIVAHAWVVVLLFIVSNAIYHGLSEVNNGYLLDIIKTSKFKATLLSVKGMINLLFSAIAPMALGYMIEHTSYPAGFLLLGIVLLVLLVPLYAYMYRNKLTRA